MRQIWYNFNFFPESEAKISIFDSALMFGDMVFEMTRTFNKRIFKLHEHFIRLENGCKILQIELPYSFEALEDIYKELHEINTKEMQQDDEIRGLINISRGTLPIYKGFIDNPADYTIIMACFPLRHIINPDYYSGVNLMIPSQRAIPEYLLDPKIKSRSRQHLKMADLQAKDKMPLLIDLDGFIAETSGANFFIVKDEKVYTPEGRNCLRGISRQYVIELCYMKGIECFEKNLTVYDAITADEAFLTCTPYSIIPVKTINEHSLKCIGEITQYLIDSWIKLVKCDFVKQAERWEKGK